MEDVSAYPYPPQLPDCLQPDSLVLACNGCPWLEESVVLAGTNETTSTGCEYRDVALAKAALTASVEVLGQTVTEQQKTIDTLVDRLVNIRLDSLAVDSFTPEGLRDLMNHDTALQAEFAEGRNGLIRLDGRFVNLVNTFGSEKGDQLLEYSGEEIAATTHAQTRTNIRREEDRSELENAGTPLERLSYPQELDIVCRQGGDEFAVIIRNVTPDKLQEIASRVAVGLDVAAAVDRYHNGQPPFIASVGIAHTADIPANERAASNTWDIYNQANAQADDGQRSDKKHQYSQMWELAHGAMPAEIAAGHLVQPASNPETAALFLQHVCPRFYENPAQYLSRQA